MFTIGDPVTCPDGSGRFGGYLNDTLTVCVVLLDPPGPNGPTWTGDPAQVFPAATAAFAAGDKAVTSFAHTGTVKSVDPIKRTVTLDYPATTLTLPSGLVHKV